MNKIIALITATLLLLITVGCTKRDLQEPNSQTTNSMPKENTSNTETTDYIYEEIIPTPEENPFANYEISENAKYAYDYSFAEYFSPGEYVNLISNLKTIINDDSIEPIYAINDSLFFVKRTIDTYDKFEESIAIVDINGNFTTDWNTNWGDYDIQFRAKCGDYFFIINNAGLYNIYECDVVNQEGKVIANVHCMENRYDLGEGYVFFSAGSDYGKIMNDIGEVIELQYKSVIPTYDKDVVNFEIGRISEGLFYGFSKGNVNTVAYYYNTNGEVVIDLSTRAVDFEVTELSEFSNGQAQIKFIGANGKNYCASIDKSGNFIGEPTEY